MSVHEYTRADGHGGLSFDRAIGAALPSKVYGVACNRNDCFITFVDTLTAGEITTLNGAVSGFSNLDNLKELRKTEIDARTRELIDAAQTTGDGTVDAITFAAVSLRDAIDAAVNEAEVDAVVDTRM